jgi:hypothetical protein
MVVPVGGGCTSRRAQRPCDDPSVVGVVRVLFALVGAGCGRVAFDPLEVSADDAGSGSGAVVVVDFPAVGCASLNLVGIATCSSDAILLTPSTPDVSGAVWAPVALGPSSKLSMMATMELIMPMGSAADGFAFVGQSVGPNAIGGNGDGLGFGNLQPSFAASFDVFMNAWDPFPHTLGAHVDGNWMFPVVETMAPFDLTVIPFTIWLDYDGATDVVAVYCAAATKPATPTLTTTKDLAMLGSPAWFGMTASTGGDAVSHRILALRIVVEP